MKGARTPLSRRQTENSQAEKLRRGLDIDQGGRNSPTAPEMIIGSKLEDCGTEPGCHRRAAIALHRDPHVMSPVTFTK